MTYLRRRKPMRRVSTRHKSVRAVDKLFRNVLLSERGSVCEWCKREGQVQVSHILNKGSYPRSRFHRQNVLLLCMRCHLFKWHRDPLAANKWLAEYKGADYYDKLRAIDRLSRKVDLALLKTAFEQEAKQ